MSEEHTDLIQISSQQVPDPVTANCSICLSDFSIIEFPAVLKENCLCEHILFEICLPCLDQWVKTHFSSTSFVNNFVVPFPVNCISEKCETKLNVDGLVNACGFAQFPETEKELTRIYLRQKYDVLSCPNSACSYSGFTNTLKCSANYECPACNTQWRQSRDISLWRKMINQPKEFKSEFVKLLRTKNCPQCESPIEKNGGCKNMTCKVCNLYFCWSCMNPNSKHPASCTIRILIKSAFYVSPIVYYFYRKGFFAFSKSVQWIQRPTNYKETLLFPFKSIGFSCRILSYYYFSIACTIFSGYMLKSLCNTLGYLGTKTANLFRSADKKKFSERKNILTTVDKATILISGAVTLITGCILRKYGSVNEFKVLLGWNVLGGTFLVSSILNS